MGTTNKTAGKRKVKRRTKAQVETDRRLAALRKNLAAEIEADLGRFAGDSQSAMAGLAALTRVRILLAFLQAFFPMFIRPPKPRKVSRKPARRRGKARKTNKTASGKRSKQKRHASREEGTASSPAQSFVSQIPPITVSQGLVSPRTLEPAVVASASRTSKPGAANTGALSTGAGRTAKPARVKVIDITQHKA